MFKPKIAHIFLLLAFTLSLVSQVSVAQVKPQVVKKAWKRPVTYLMPTPRVKAKKYVYHVETSHVTRAIPGQHLPSQVAINTRSASNDGSTFSLKQKPKVQRSIASE